MPYTVPDLNKATEGDQMNHLISKLAKDLGISEIDVRCFANAIINDMNRDSIGDAFISMTEKERTSVIQAYAIDSVKKMDQFVMTYQNNPQAAEAFRATVRSLI